MLCNQETTLCKEDTINEQHDIEHENSLLSFSHSSEVEMRETNAYTTSFGQSYIHLTCYLNDYMDGKYLDLKANGKI